MPTQALQSPPVTGVDCHAHVMRRDAPLAKESHSAPLHDATPDEFVALLDSQGLSHGVLAAPSFYGADNTLLLQALAKYPARLRGTAIVEPDITDADLEKLRAAGVAGLRLNWFHRAALPDAGGRSYQRLFSAARGLGLHIELYVEGALMPDVLHNIRKSGVRVVLDHFGSPDPAEGIAGAGFRSVLDAVAAGGCWVKLSAPYRLGGADPRPYADALVAAGGPQRLIWASDWPWVSFEDGRSYRACLDDLRRWVPDDVARRAILTETPATLFGF